MTTSPRLQTLALPVIATLTGSLTVSSNAMLPTCQATAVRDRLLQLSWSGSSAITNNLADACS